MTTPFVWVDGPFGGTPVTAANLNAAMGVSDAAIANQINTPASQTTAALNATYVNKPSGIADGQVPVWQASTSTFVPGSGGGGAPSTLDGGNATSVYTGTFNFDGGSAT